MKKFISEFFKKVKHPEKLQNAFEIKDKEIFSKNFIDGHFSFLMSSKKYPDKNVTKNFTSSENIKVKNEDNIEEKIKCLDKYTPNLKNQNKINFLTPTYELNKKETIIKEVNKDIQIKMQNSSKNVYNSIINDKDKPILYSENGKFYSKNNSFTVKEYTKEFKISIYDKIKCLDDFEKENENYLNSEEGKKDYEIFKNIIKGVKFNNNFDNDV